MVSAVWMGVLFMVGLLIFFDIVGSLLRNDKSYI